jgi:hypothetical protein
MKKKCKHTFVIERSVGISEKEAKKTKLPLTTVKWLDLGCTKCDMAVGYHFGDQDERNLLMTDL